MLLGMGADGHVGSLYPFKPTLEGQSGAWVLPFQVGCGVLQPPWLGSVLCMALGPLH